MNKHLKVEVNGAEWVNGDFAEISFTDGPGGVRIEAKTARAVTPPRGGGGLLEMLTNASKARTEAVAEEKRSAPVEEPVEVVDAEPVDS